MHVYIQMQYQTHFCSTQANDFISDHSSKRIPFPSADFFLGKGREDKGPRMMDMLFGDVEAAGAGMSAPDDDNPLSKESMEEAFGFMRNVAEEWNREDEERRLDKAKLKLAIYAPFAPGQVRHGPGKIHFAAQIQTTIQRLRRLQTTVHAYRRQEILP